MKKTILVTALGAFGACAGNTLAIDIYTDRAAFEAASTGLTNITFDGLAPDAFYTDYGATGLDQSGVHFDGGGYLFVVDPLYSPDYYDWGSDDILLGASGGSITATLPGGITAVGSDIMSIIPYGATITFTTDSGETASTASSMWPERAFLGVISTSPIKSVTVTADSGAYPELDNFEFGTAIPAPGSLALLGLGALAARRRR